MKNNKRKEVDSFLIWLDSFLEKNINNLSEEEILNLTLPIRIGKPSSSWPREILEIKTLAPLINKNSWKRLKRKNNYLMRVAYKLKYIKVKWYSYDEIFSKIVWLKPEIWTLVIQDFYKENDWQEFIIPEDYWQINFDMHYIWNYDIIK